MFSTTKGVTAICASRLEQDGVLDTDAPVVRYWPEFGKNGKEDIPVSYLLSHQAGLAWVDGEMTAEEALSWEPVIEALQNQHPHWHPGTQHGYHATTYGWLVGEVIRRAAGSTVGTYLREEIAGPLGLDLWIGLPEAEERRVSPLISMLPEGVSVDSLANPGDDPVLAMIAQFLGPDTCSARRCTRRVAPWPTRTFGTPAPCGPPSCRRPTACRTPARWPACTEPASARSTASASSSRPSCARATAQRTEGPNQVLLGLDIQFGLGFMVRSSIIPLGGPASFGHFGAGGSVGWADPDAEIWRSATS